MEFEERKRRFLERLKECIEKGEVDEDIIEVLEMLNSLENYFTTSSCSGRIILIRPGKKKIDTEILFKSHRKVSFEEIKGILENLSEKYDEIWLKVEPVILHVDCRDLESARKMLDVARESGWKRSGLMVIRPKRYLLELESTERLETIVSKDGRILPDEEYLRILIEKANERLERTKEKLERFRRRISHKFYK